MQRAATRELKARGTPLAMLFIIALFLVRFGLRSVLQAQSTVLGLNSILVSDAFLAMACGLFIIRSVELWLRAQKLFAKSPAVADAV